MLNPSTLGRIVANLCNLIPLLRRVLFLRQLHLRMGADDKGVCLGTVNFDCEGVVRLLRAGEGSGPSPGTQDGGSVPVRTPLLPSTVGAILPELTAAGSMDAKSRYSMKREVSNEIHNFNCEFKLEAANLIRERIVSYAQTACDLDTKVNMLGRWVKEFDTDLKHTFPLGLMKPEQLEIDRLRKEVAELRASVTSERWPQPTSRRK